MLAGSIESLLWTAPTERIKILQQKNPNKINYIYVLTPRGIAEKTKLTLNFMKRKMKEYDELKKELQGKK